MLGAILVLSPEVEGVEQLLLLLSFLLLEQQQAFNLADVLDGPTQFILDGLCGSLLLGEFRFLVVVLHDQGCFEAQDMSEKRLPVSMRSLELTQMEHIAEIVL